jgi:hypothetical protein
MTLAAASTSGTAEQAMSVAMLSIEKVVRSEGGAVTAATETQLQNALYLLRCNPSDAATMRRMEEAAVTLRIMVVARREGRLNLYASRLARLRRVVSLAG